MALTFPWRTAATIRFALLFLLAAAARGPLRAQETVAPIPDLLQPGTDTLYQYLIRGTDTTFVGTVIDALERTTLDGRAVLRRVYSGDSRLTGASRDTLIDDAATLRPLRTASYSLRAIEHVEYSRERAVGWRQQPTGDSVRIDVAIPAQVYSASSFDLVLRAAELDDGWAATVPAFVASSRVVVPMTAKVVGEERVDGWECWRVDAEFMVMAVTFWVERETRKLCRQEMRLQVGMALLFTRRGPGALRRGAT